MARASSAKASAANRVPPRCDERRLAVPAHREPARGEQGHPDLERGKLGGAEAGCHEHRQEHRRAQARGAQEQPAAARRAAEHPPAVRSERRALAPGVPHDDDEVDGHHAPLGEDGAKRRADQAESQAVDEPEIEQDVHQEADPGDPERSTGVLQAAEQAGRGEDQQHRRHPEHREPQVIRRRAGHLGFGAERGHQRRRGEPAGHGKHQAETERQPEPVDAHRHCLPAVAGAEPARHGRGGAVGEEHHQPDDGLQHRAGQAETGQGNGAEVADHGRIGQQEQRLGHERPEGRHGQPEDLPVDRLAA
jgi:hypothetical protein